jgi:hypothetical protein
MPPADLCNRARVPLRQAAAVRLAWVVLWIALGLVLVLSGCAANKSTARMPARLALVIGNAAYQNARPLNNPVHDAQDMCQALRGVGFVTLCRTDLRTRAEFVALVDEYAGRLGPGTIGLVYYAGHGVQVGGANYLVPTQGQPVGAAANPLAALYAVEDLFERLRDRPAHLNIVMLDACRTELFEDTPRPATRCAFAPDARVGIDTPYRYGAGTHPGRAAAHGGVVCNSGQVRRL